MELTGSSRKTYIKLKDLDEHYITKFTLKIHCGFKTVSVVSNYRSATATPTISSHGSRLRS
jgi:hypothetical protein